VCVLCEAVRAQVEREPLQVTGGLRCYRGLTCGPCLNSTATGTVLHGQVIVPRSARPSHFNVKVYRDSPPPHAVKPVPTNDT